MIHTAGHIDNLQPHRMTIKITSALNRQKKAVNGSKVLFLGVAYKPDIDDPRESPALKIMDEVIHKKGIVSYHDPYVPEVETHEGVKFASVPLTEQTLAQADCVVITTNHKKFDPEFIYKHSKLIVDLRNAVRVNDDKVYKL